MTRRLKLKLLLAATATGFVLLALEAATRLLIRPDPDGNLQFGGTRLKPYRVPVQHALRTLKRYLATTNSVLIYDADLGWAPRPSQHFYNSAGIWSDGAEFATNRPADRLRIALFGASYTQGRKFEPNWGLILEAELRRAGAPAEVLNFSVPAYGMDQVYLRWKKLGPTWNPHVVVFGLHFGNCFDNANLFRPFQHPGTGIPFLKPRFTVEGGALKLINHPPPAPETLPALFRDFQSWPLLRYEYFYRPEDYRWTPLRRSRLGALVEAKIEAALKAHPDAEFMRMDGEAAKVTLLLVEQFKRDVEAADARFYAVHLPALHHLQTLQRNGRYDFAELLDAVKARIPVIEPDREMLKAAGQRPLHEFFTEEHYTEVFERVIGSSVADYLRERETPAPDAKRK